MNTDTIEPIADTPIEASALPTWETIAEGKFAGRNPAFLKKDERLLVCLEIERLGKKDKELDAVFASIGLDRKRYYSWIWLTDDERAPLLKILETQRAAEKGSAEGSSKVATTNNIQRRAYVTRAEIRKSVEEAGRLTYMEGLPLDEACRRMHITRNTYFKVLGRKKQRAIKHGNMFERLQAELAAKAERKAERASRGLTPHTERESTAFSEVAAETLEARRTIVESIHTLVVEGMELRKAARQNGIYAKTYHQWAREIEDADKPPVRDNLELWQEYKQTTDPLLLEQFLNQFKRMAQKLAQRYASRARHRTGIDFDEEVLVSVGMFEGIVQNMDVFDPERGVPIQSFFGQKMAQRMLDEVRVMDWIPRVEYKRFGKINEQRDAFEKAKGRPPANDDELVEFAGTLPTFMGRLDHPYYTSSDAPIPTRAGRSAKELHLSDILSDPFADFEQDQEQTQLLADQIMGGTHNKERNVLSLYYQEGLTMREIGQRLGLSESRVSQMHSQIILELRERLRMTGFHMPTTELVHEA